MPIFDVVAMLTVCSIIDHCVQDKNCTSAIWTQSSHKFYTQYAWHYWN